LTPLQVSWSPDGSKIAGLYNNAEIKIYDISTKQEYIQPENIQKMKGGFLWIDEMILLYNSNLRIQIWNIQSAETEMLIDPELGSPDLIALSPNGNTLAYVDFGGVVYLVDVESEEILYIIDTEITSGIQDVAWSSDNKMLGVASAWDKKVIVINAETGIVTNTLEDDSLRQYIYLAWTNNNNELLTGAGEGKILIWETD